MIALVRNAAGKEDGIAVGLGGVSKSDSLVRPLETVPRLLTHKGVSKGRVSFLILMSTRTGNKINVHN